MRVRGGLLGAVVLAGLIPVVGSVQARPTLTTISVDGQFADWQRVMANHAQVTWDGDGSSFGRTCVGAVDRDCAIGSTGRDIYRFAWTYDDDALYLFTERVDEGNNAHQYFYFFMDLDADAIMGPADKVLRASWSPNNPVETVLFEYVPADPAGDPMVSAAGWADGYAMPGALSDAVSWTASQPGQGGLSFEIGVPWTALGVPARTPIKFHVAAANSATGFSDAEDNCGGPDGRLGTFGFFGVEVRPDHVGGSLSPGETRYAHEVVNTGNDEDTFRLWTDSSRALRTALYADPDGDGVGDVLLAVDADGDGRYDGPGDSVSSDSDGDGWPDTGALAGGAVFPVVVHLTVPWGLNGRVDRTRLHARSTFAPVYEDSAEDVTGIGVLVIVPDGDLAGQSGATVLHRTTLLNNASTTETGRLRADGLLGWPVEVFVETSTGRTRLEDKDGDGLLETDPIPAGGRLGLQVAVHVPGDATMDARELSRITVAPQAEPTATFTARFGTRVAPAVEIRPSYRLADDTNLTAIPGDLVYFPQVLYNNQDAADCFDLSAVSSNGWTVHVWSDPDGDGSISDGRIVTSTCGDPALAPFGGAWPLVVEVVVPAGAAYGAADTTRITATAVAGGLDAAAVDETRVGHLVAYQDPSLGLQGRAYATCATAFIQAGGLASGTYRLDYVAPGGTVTRSAVLTPDGRGRALDAYTFDAVDPLGGWTVNLVEAATGAVLETLPLRVERSGRIVSAEVAPAGDGEGVAVDLVLESTNRRAPFVGTVVRMTVVSPDGRYLTADGNLAPYTGAEVSRQVGGVDLDAGAWTTVGLAIPAANLPQALAGPWEVRVSWDTSCGAPIASTVAALEVVPPAPTILQPSDGWATRDPDVTVAGTGLPGASVELSLDGTWSAPRPVAADGTWSTTYAALPDGTYRLVAVQTDDGGRTSNPSPAVAFTVDTVAPDAPRVLVPTEGEVLGTSAVTVEGTAEPGSTVVVREGGAEVGRGEVVADGTWSVQVALADGPHDLAVEAEDAAGNVSPATDRAFVVDTVAPDAPLVVTPVDGAMCAHAQVWIEGTAEPDSLVTVYEGTTALGSVRAAADGRWSLWPTFADGTHVVQAVAEDAAGNVSGPSSAVGFLVDTTPPDPPVLQTPTDGSVLVAADVSLAGTAEAGATVSVYDGADLLGTVVAAADGTWRLDVTFADGEHVLTAEAADVLENLSAPSDPATVVVDTVAPPAAVIERPAEGAVIGSRLVAVSGTAEPGTAIRVHEGTLVVGETQAAADGRWEVSNLLTQGRHVVVAESTDAAGHAAPASAARTFTVDTLAPDAPAIVAPLDGTRTRLTEHRVAGTAEAAGALRLFVDDVLAGETTVATDGTWAVPVTLGEGLHRLVAEVQDGLGHLSPRSGEVEVEVDRTGPAAPVIDAPVDGGVVDTLSLVAVGHTDEAAVVRIYLDGAPVGGALADVAGAFRLPVDGLAEGPHALRGEATDALGNGSGFGPAITFEVRLPEPPAPPQDPPEEIVGVATGCGCTAGGGSGRSGFGLLLAGLGLLVRRRRLSTKGRR